MIKIIAKLFKIILFISGVSLVIAITRWLLLPRNKKKADTAIVDIPYIELIPLAPVAYETFQPSWRIRLAAQTVGLTFTIAIITFVLLQNFSPFGMKMIFAQSDATKNVSALGPKDRVNQIKLNGQTVSQQIGDLIYFTTKMPYHFDKGTVRITFKNPYPDQDIFLGFNDQSDYHYNTKLIDSPILNAVTWPKVSNSLTLFQRQKKYSTVNAFMKSPPTDSLVGTYDLTDADFNPYISDLPGYTPAKTPTVIPTPLRGTHTMLVFLKNEPFKLKITKQDLNWYKGPDDLTIKIYKGRDEVMEKVISDDGIDDDSHQVGKPQTTLIQNPGPGLPENGVYRVVLQTSGDTIIKRIETNLHKIVFANFIFPIANATVYPKNIASTSATVFTTNALLLDMTTYHPAALQTVSVGTTSAALTKVNVATSVIPKDAITSVTLPRSDVIVNSTLGYFSFSKDQFFNPTTYTFTPIIQVDQLAAVDYILTDYTPSVQDGNYRISQTTFDLQSANITNGQLSWIIKAPNLGKLKRQIIIKDITLELDKKPLVKL